MVCLAAVSLVIFTHRAVLQHGMPSKLVTGHHTQGSTTTWYAWQLYHWSSSHIGQYCNMVCLAAVSLVIFTHRAVLQHGMPSKLVTGHHTQGSTTTWYAWQLYHWSSSHIGQYCNMVCPVSLSLVITHMAVLQHGMPGSCITGHLDT